MFTGLVQAVGTVQSNEGVRLRIAAPAVWDDPIRLGESLAVNGCCLTVAGREGGIAFDLSEETRIRTTLGELPPDARVNLERALRAGDRIGGHFVQGHVDGVGRLLGRTHAEGSEMFQFEVPAEGAKFLIDKGSIALNGVSLTVIQPEEGRFWVAVIPTTLAQTTMGSWTAGDAVNVEYDVLAKHVARLLHAQ